MDKIDTIYYINLLHRTDRKEQMLEWLHSSGFSNEIIRINGVYNKEKGYIGCTQSHILALENFIESKKDMCIIYEDDYQPFDSHNYWSNVKKILDTNMKFDVILLAYNDYNLQIEETDYDYIKQVKHTYTASGYLITKEFAPILLSNFRECLALCILDEQLYGRRTEQYCVDVHWIKLMKSYIFLCFYPRLGKQRESYSDIIKKTIDYKC